MVRWRGVVRAIVPALLLFFPIIIAIAYVGYSYLRGYGVSTDSLLAIVILFQTYIIWIQVEIALRQTTVFKTEYEPILRLKTNRFINPANILQTTVSIENVGKSPAYSINIGLIDKPFQEPFDKVARFYTGQPLTLAPSDCVDVFNMSSEEFDAMEVEIHVFYENVMMERNHIGFIKTPKGSDFLLYHAPLNVRQGILLKSLEGIKLAYQAVKWGKYPKKAGNE